MNSLFFILLIVYIVMSLVGLILFIYEVRNNSQMERENYD